MKTPRFPQASTRNSAWIRGGALALLLLLPGGVRPSVQPPGPTPPPSNFCPCGLPDWAVQSIFEVPSRVAATTRSLRVRVANVGTGTSLYVPAKIVWMQQIDNYFTQHTTYCGLFYNIFHNGVPVQWGTAAIPSIPEGGYTDIPVTVPGLGPGWTVEVEVVPMIGFADPLLPPMGIPE